MDGKWRVVTEQGQEGVFEAVVLTLPVPQVFAFDVVVVVADIDVFL